MTNPDTLAGGVKLEATERERWREMVQAHAAAMRMVIDAVEELFGPIASMESEDASLLRGPEPHHRAEGVVEALQRVRQVIPSVDAEARKRAIIAGWKDYSGNADFEEIETVIDTALDTLFAASPPKPSEAMVALREALEAARTWHEAEDKALSKQPPSHGPNGNQWARLQHQEQIAEITAALSGGAK